MISLMMRLPIAYIHVCTQYRAEAPRNNPTKGSLFVSGGARSTLWFVPFYFFMRYKKILKPLDLRPCCFRNIVHATYVLRLGPCKQWFAFLSSFPDNVRVVLVFRNPAGHLVGILLPLAKSFRTHEVVHENLAEWRWNRKITTCLCKK